MNNSIIDQIFRNRFSFVGDGIRDEQRLVIESILAGHNTLSIMPTGGGKSLCYWVAGSALQGTTLVIFPLTALMDEQARKLEAHGLKVVNLHSGISATKQYQQLLELHHGKMPDFIFTSPERIGNDGFLEFILRQRRSEIKLVVIDEIHCISQWGHDFRPFYQEIPPFLDAVYDVPNQWPVVLGLTATLNQKDTLQACQDFHIDPKHVLKSQYLLRYPIEIRVVKVKDEPEKDQIFWAHLSQHRHEKVLVYIDNRNSGERSTEGFCEHASAEGFQAEYFHADMTSQAKADVIEKFKSGEVLTVFATSAFGMGIDIPDIRGVIHYRPPESIEQFYQQIGRTGRDGRPAWALLYFSTKNVDFRKAYFIDRSFPDEATILKTFDEITSGRGSIKSFDYFSFSENGQTAFHYLLRSGALKVRCKSVQRFNVFECKKNISLPHFDKYHQESRAGITALVPDKVSESIEQMSENIYRWWAEGKIKTTGNPQKCLMIEQLAPSLSEDKVEEILRDTEAKKAYRHQLLDQLVELLDGYTNSISLHQQIGRYLGVDKFQADRIYQTVSGEMVRSKSEVIIADLLSMNGISFVYEKQLEAGGIDFLPDFTLYVNGKEYYWEHLGRLDLEQYRQNWAIKKAWYEKHFPGQLITTEEGSTLSQTTELLIKQLIGDTSSQKLDIERISEGITQKMVKTVQVWTEGRTDWKHLKAAFRRLKAEGYYSNLEIDFQEVEEDMGDKELLTMCRTYSRREQNEPVICVFDRDVPSTLKNITDDGKDFKDWGHRVYSVALPIPAFRTDTPDICIEFCYQDQAIHQEDKNGRRLYIGTEFSNRSGIHNNREVTCSDRNKTGKFTIIDDAVFRVGDKKEDNIALSKNQFANYVLNEHSGFNKFDVSGFFPIFELIQKITEIVCWSATS